MRASPKRALRRLPSTFARNTPARSQYPGLISTSRTAPCPAVACPRQSLPPERRSTYWYRRRSSVRLELGRSSGKVNRAPKLTELRIGLRCCDKLQSCPNRLGEARTACSLRLLEKIGRYLDRYLTGSLGHAGILPYWTPASNMVFKRDPRRSIQAEPKHDLRGLIPPSPTLRAKVLT